MFIEIDPTLPQAIYQQIAQQIRFAIANEAFRANELIPSVRELAKMLALNPNTVSNAFRELQDQGLVYPRRGMGLAVAENAAEKCRADRLEHFQQRFRQLFAEAARSGLEREEIETLSELGFSQD